MKNFLTSLAAVIIALVGAMLLLGAKLSDMPRMAGALFQRIMSAAAAPSATPENSPAPAVSPPRLAQPAPPAPAAQPQSTPAVASLTLATLKMTPWDWPKSVALRKQMEFPAVFNGNVVGNVEVGPGVMVDLVSVEDGGMLRAQYQGAVKEIPAAATDVLDRAQGEMTAKAQAMAREQEARSQFNLRFIAADGSLVDISNLRGHVVLVDFWATWCGPCMQEVPEVVATYRKYHDSGFDIIGISFDRDKAAMLAVTRSQGMPWPQYFDGNRDNDLSSPFSIHQIPTMWLVNKKGVLVNTDARGNLESEVTRLLAE